MLKKQKDEGPTDENEYVRKIDADCFTIGQCYEELPAKKLECKKCGGDKFLVGKGSYFTALKCPVCNYEICIHDG